MYCISIKFPDFDSYTFVIIFYWSIVDLQCCLNYCYTENWFSHTYIYILFLKKIIFHYGLSQDIEHTSLCSNILLLYKRNVLFLQFSSVQSLSGVRLFVTPWTSARQDSLSITNSQSLPKSMSIESVMPSNHLILCHPFLLLLSIFPSIRVFSNESVSSSQKSVLKNWVVWVKKSFYFQFQMERRKEQGKGGRKKGREKERGK